MSSNPFLQKLYADRPPTGAIDVTGRLSMAKNFDRSQCEAALQVSGLQKAVEKAIKRRIKQLETTND